MTVQTTTHLNFRGQAREALGFYASVFGGEQTIVTYGDLGAAQDPGQAAQVIWGQVVSPDGFRVMAFDVQPAKPWQPGENAFYVSGARATRRSRSRLFGTSSVMTGLSCSRSAPRRGRRSTAC